MFICPIICGYILPYTKVIEVIEEGSITNDGLKIFVIKTGWDWGGYGMNMEPFLSPAS